MAHNRFIQMKPYLNLKCKEKHNEDLNSGSNNIFNKIQAIKLKDCDVRSVQ